MSNLNLEYIHPQPIWWIDLDINLKNLQKMVYGFIKKLPNQGNTNRGKLNYQSSNILNEQITNNQFLLLLKQIKMYVRQAFDSYKPLSSTVDITNMWINVSNEGGYNEVHMHPGASIAGVYYVKVPNGDCGQIVFHRNSAETYTIQSLGSAEDISTVEMPHTHAHWTYPPKENRLFIFPAWIPHSVRENNTKEDRISISFNFQRMSNK